MKILSLLFVSFFFSPLGFSGEPPKFKNILKVFKENPKAKEEFFKGDLTYERKLVINPGTDKNKEKKKEEWDGVLVRDSRSKCQVNKGGFYICAVSRKKDGKPDVLYFAVYKKRRHPFDTFDLLMKSFKLKFRFVEKNPYCAHNSKIQRDQGRLCVLLHEDFDDEIIANGNKKKSKPFVNKARAYLVVTNHFVYLIGIGIGLDRAISFNEEHVLTSAEGYYIFENENDVVPVHDRMFHLKYLYGSDRVKYVIDKKHPLIQKHEFFPGGENNVTENFRKYLRLEREYLNSLKKSK